MTPNRVNRPHWPTKENIEIFTILFDFFGAWTKWPGMATNEVRRFFFRVIQTFPAQTPGIFCVGRENPKIEKKYFPQWANGPYSPGLGSCAGVIDLCVALMLMEERSNPDPGPSQRTQG